MDKHSTCKDEKPQKKRKHDDDDEDEDEIEEKRTMRDMGITQVRVDRDKNCPGIVHTIVGGPPASRHAACSPSASSSKRGKGQELCHVETKRIKIDNTIVFRMNILWEFRLYTKMPL